MPLCAPTNPTFILSPSVVGFVGASVDVVIYSSSFSPRMYTAMAQPSRYPELVAYAGVVVVVVYMAVMACGYYFYGQYVVTPGIYNNNIYMYILFYVILYI